jgi:hypothetical protein
MAERMGFDDMYVYIGLAVLLIVVAAFATWWWIKRRSHGVTIVSVLLLALASGSMFLLFALDLGTIDAQSYMYQALPYVMDERSTVSEYSDQYMTPAQAHTPVTLVINPVAFQNDQYYVTGTMYTTVCLNQNAQHYYKVSYPTTGGGYQVFEMTDIFPSGEYSHGYTQTARQFSLGPFPTATDAGVHRILLEAYNQRDTWIGIQNFGWEKGHIDYSTSCANGATNPGACNVCPSGTTYDPDAEMCEEDPVSCETDSYCSVDGTQLCTQNTVDNACVEACVPCQYGCEDNMCLNPDIDLFTPQPLVASGGGCYLEWTLSADIQSCSLYQDGVLVESGITQSGSGTYGEVLNKSIFILSCLSSNGQTVTSETTCKIVPSFNEF